MAFSVFILVRREDREGISWSLTLCIQKLRTWPSLHFAWRITKVLHDKTWLWGSFGFVTTTEWCLGFSRLLLLNGKVCGGQEKRPVRSFSEERSLLDFFFFWLWLNPGVIGDSYTSKVHGLHYLNCHGLWQVGQEAYDNTYGTKGPERLGLGFELAVRKQTPGYWPQTCVCVPGSLANTAPWGQRNLPSPFPNSERRCQCCPAVGHPARLYPVLSWDNVFKASHELLRILPNSSFSLQSF